NVLPPDERRPGYPENLTITFSDVPLDTSIAAIGAPSTPAHFKVETEDGRLRLEFSFRDLDGDRTLSSVGEFIDVRMPETEGAARTVLTWRIEVTSAPEPLSPPGNGDVYHLVLLWDEFALDSDPETWQRVALPLRDALSDPTWNATQVWLPMFIHGGPNDIPKTMWFDRISVIRNDDIAFIDEYQRLAFDYFWIEANPQNGLVKDRSRATSSVSSIAAVGFGLSAYTVGADRGWITREQAVERTLNTLRFFWNAPQSTAADATGYKGFFYHFLNMSTGRRAGTNELSTIDTALLLAGILHSREYYDRPDAGEEEIRALADSIYERVDWQWAQPRPPAVSLGWHPDSGFIGFDWIGYNEAMILYILALGSPTHPVDPSAWAAWTSRYDSDWQTHYGITFLTFPPLFGHQYSHVWIDFRGIADSFMRSKGIDYFENSRRATLAQRLYHGANPRGWPNYSLDEWGLTASDIPSGYRARGAPPAQNDEGTLAPTAPGGSIAFTPEESIAALRTMRRKYPNLWGPYGLRDAYNVAEGWFDVDYLGIDQGPILLMAENYRTERVWDVFMQNEAVQRGLERAGFEPVDTSIEGEIPRSGISLDNYPNPFSESTQVTFEIPAPGPVRLVVYDLLGREVKVLLDAFRSAGKHSLTMNGSLLAAGVYFYRLETSKGPQTGKMILIR
ncbi:MAG: T9SS type A sorting domain-containing protein, partial [Rhodothermales bacterium]|nr:T9SS type A sorting domain-containing protein [Rhodothermales bacterium]